MLLRYNEGIFCFPALAAVFVLGTLQGNVNWFSKLICEENSRECKKKYFGSESFC